MATKGSSHARAGGHAVGGARGSLASGDADRVRRADLGKIAGEAQALLRERGLRAQQQGEQPVDAGAAEESHPGSERATDVPPHSRKIAAIAEMQVAEVRRS